ncbi:FKBP-type peptidyl-prolyl cis-trans isomerase [Rhodohalobacter sp. 614A]|uniref:FKBP-type peptidyl-prolyl cis-trans isomerase n=1 Tax=Rhodohalobacter sp. 614A TaxID=2908649 RepID=UPI001F3FF20C|nr:FKBP-type peptidyl-prolyl cis-trans isomerase [Rhodohalobacter sp. 614A]
MQLSRISILSIFLFLFIIVVSCDTSDPYRFEPPDYSTVPEAFDTTNVESVDIYEGVKVYLHEEGFGPFEVNHISSINAYLTLRTESGAVIFSTFADGQSSPVNISIANSDGQGIIVQNPYDIFVTHTPGFQRGLLGMKDGEKRTIVVSPDQGFKAVPSNNRTSQYVEETLIYDILITDIGPTKSR